MGLLTLFPARRSTSIDSEDPRPFSHPPAPGRVQRQQSRLLAQHHHPQRTKNGTSPAAAVSVSPRCASHVSFFFAERKGGRERDRERKRRKKEKVNGKDGRERERERETGGKERKKK